MEKFIDSGPPKNLPIDPFNEGSKVAKHQYRKRHVRSDNPPKRRFVPADLDIVRAVGEFRLINSRQLQQLMGRGKWNFLNRLQYLWQAGFLDRLEGPLDKPAVYALGPLGQQLLEDSRSGFDPKRLEGLQTKRRQRQDRNNVSDFFTNHTLLIGDIRIALSLLPKDSGAELVDWISESRDLQGSVYVPNPNGSGGQELPIKPDGFATLRVADKDRPNRHFFIEADTGSETIKSLSGNRDFFRKLPAYWQWFREKGHKRMLGIDSFRVLTVTTSAMRAANLAQVARMADPKRKGGRLFLFGCDSDFLDEPGNILGPMWLSPQDDKPRRLLD